MSTNPFPNLLPQHFHQTSDKDDNYNCIAWAAGKRDRWWWPAAGDPCAFWPIPIDPVEPESLEQFIKAFESIGYNTCANPEFENGLEKVAIFLDSNKEPTHAARMLPSGMWTSKMGAAEDIEHETLKVIEGKRYGKAVAFLSRNSALHNKAPG